MTKNIWEERRLDEPPRDGDVRSEYDRDYARLIHSSAFRRLQAKTQVLGLGESDFYRTRLTHSMEVAQIGVGILKWLQSYHASDEGIIAALPEPALMNSICLAHDIGHPPFGHGGEVALNLCMRDNGGFEGNGQTLRILSRLDKYTEKHGLNPTRRLLLGILKYPSPYRKTVQKDAYGKVPQPRWLCKAGEQHPPKCYMDEEDEVVEWILSPLNDIEKQEFSRVHPHESGHLKPIHKGLDTSIMEHADDISYSLHDLEDAISLNMITNKDWDQNNDKKEDLFKNCGINSLTLGLELFSDESYKRKRAIGGLVHEFIKNIEIRKADISNAETSLVAWNAYMHESHKKLLKHIFKLVRNKVIRSSNVQQLEFKGQKLIVELFDALNSDPMRLLPENSLKRYEAERDEVKKKRIVCDFIAGMTDEYATRLYEKLHYPHKGSIFDRL